MNKISSNLLKFALVLCLFAGGSVLQQAEAAGCQSLSSKTLKAKAKRYGKTIRSASRKYGVHPDLIAAVITIESCFRRKARGTSGEKGLMQLMPGTANLLGVKRRYNAWENIHGGTRYLSYLLRMYKGNHTRAIAAYNAGPGNVGKRSGRIRNIGYVRKVMRAYRKLSAGKKKRPLFKASKGYRFKKASSKRKSINKSRKKTAKKAKKSRKVVKTSKKRQRRSSKRSVYYTVRNGDTLYSVMRKTGVNVKRLKQLNKSLKRPYIIKRGQKIRLR